jgi:hypothetical protein
MPATAKAESLQMQFCINCHAAPQNQLRPRSEVFNNEWQPPPDQAALGRALMQMSGVEAKLSCSTCHR